MFHLSEGADQVPGVRHGVQVCEAVRERPAAVHAGDWGGDDAPAAVRAQPADQDLSHHVHGHSRPRFPLQ